MANEVRLIDANALSRRVFDASYWDNQDEDVIWNLVQDAPTVDAVEVVHGRWIRVFDDSAGWVDMCNKCKGFGDGTPHCPNCGADMRGETE